LPTILQALLNGPGSWGVTEEEKRLEYGVDRLELKGEELFRGITINAPAPVIFRWLLQLKVAPYSYDLLDNFGRQSPRQLTPGVEKLESGQTFMFIFDLVGFMMERSLILRLKPIFTLGGMVGDTAISYDIRDSEAGSCRLLVKIVVKYPWGPFGWPGRLILPPGDLVMMRKQLVNIKELAEEQAARESGSAA